MKTDPTSVQHRYKIELVTVSDIRRFVSTASECEGSVMLSVGDTFLINAKSLLGVMLAKNMDWANLTLIAENDCYESFKQFIVS